VLGINIQARPSGQSKASTLAQREEGKAQMMVMMMMMKV